MLKFKLIIILSLILISMPSLAQQDSTQTTEEWEWHWNDFENWEDWAADFDFKKSRPAISLQYGIADLSLNDIQSKFVDPSLIELKLGYIKERNAWKTDNIIKHNYRYLYLSNESNSLAGKEAVGTEIETDTWRFGAGWSSGYGYKIGEHSSIVPYYTYSINWSNIKITYPSIMTFAPDSDRDKLSRYNESFRFGTSNEGGIRIKVIDNLVFDAGYERSIVFERHLFWKWAGSAIIEAAAQGLLDGFINEVFESSPDAGPIVNFLLKNALAYGIYELRQDKMNWPFKSAAPFTFDQFKFGVTVVF